MSNVSCPLNFKQVDENLFRINALFVSLFVLLYLYTQMLPIMLFLVLDFSIKLFFEKLISPLTFFSQVIKKIFRIEDLLIDGGAKRLAGFFGFFFMILLLVTYFFHSLSLSLVVAALYLICSSLDILFGFCIGCKIYFIIKKVYPNFMR